MILKKVTSIFFVILAFCLLGIAWSFFIEPNLIVVERLSLVIDGLPSSFEGVRIVHISDLHSRNFGKREQEVLNILEELAPDLVFITGDLVDWTTDDIDSCRVFWEELSQDYQGKLFMVQGNHEHRNLKFRTLKSVFKESGLEVLNNRSRKIGKNGDFLYLIGVDDPHLSFDDIKKAMEGVESDAPKILLAHSPEIFKKVKEEDIDLVLVGHTHGGQIDIPWLVDFILPLKYDKKYKRGLFKESSTYLYVSRGIGTTFLPLRFNSLPEITLIELTGKDLLE